MSSSFKHYVKCGIIKNGNYIFRNFTNKFDEHCTSAQLFTFSSNSIKSYSGNEPNIVLPKSYSISTDESGTDAFIDGEDYAVTKIYLKAFANNSVIENVVIPDNITYIYTQAFLNCSNLKSILIGKGTATIIEGLTLNCDNLTHISVSNENPNYYSINNCIIKSDTKRLTVGCKTSIIPTDGSVTIIGRAFDSYQSLSSIIIPNVIERIASRAFYATSLTEIDIPDSVTTIDSSAFSHCSALTTVTIGTGISSIGQSIFSECPLLTEITIKATTPPALANINAIPDNVTTIYIPAGTLSAYQSATNWSSFASKFVEMEA